MHFIFLVFNYSLVLNCHSTIYIKTRCIGLLIVLIETFFQVLPQLTKQLVLRKSFFNYIISLPEMSVCSKLQFFSCSNSEYFSHEIPPSRQINRKISWIKTISKKRIFNTPMLTIFNAICANNYFCACVCVISDLSTEFGILQFLIHF